MRNPATIVITVFLLGQACVALPSAPSFEDDHTAYIAELDAPFFQATANIEVPAVYNVFNASLNVSVMPANNTLENHPESIRIEIDDTVIWTFENTGFGPLGNQDRFFTESKTVQLTLNAAGGSQTTYVRLPKNAIIQNATMEITGTAPPIVRRHAFIPGPSAQDMAGRVSSAGDVNKDGYADVIVGAIGNDDAGGSAGRADIYLGGPVIDNVSDISMLGLAANDEFGTAADAGDLNGDGYDDVVVTAWNGNYYALIFFGGTFMDNTYDLKLSDPQHGSGFGVDVAAAGDVNRDGYDDVIVGASDAYCSTVSTGAAFLYYGGSNMDDSPDLVFYGEGKSDFYGDCVAFAGDVNSDGYDDFLVGAPSNSEARGKVYLYLGGPNMDTSPYLTFPGRAMGDNLGWAAASAGDVNGDSYDDVIIGATGVANNTGAAYLLFGGKQMDNVSDINFSGSKMNRYYGRGVSGVGDVNGDGYDDFVVGEINNDTAFVRGGCVHLYCGNGTMDNIEDLVYLGDYIDAGLGMSVSAAGDVDDDGFPDIIMGSYFGDANGDYSGYASVYAGRYSPPVLVDPVIKIGAQTIWNRTGNFSGDTSVADFSNVIGTYLKFKPKTSTDAYGNNYIDVPVTVSAKYEGCFTLFNLNIDYDCCVTVPDFSPVLNSYIRQHVNETDTNGNIKVPLKITARSAGRIKLSDLKIIPYQPPKLLKPVPDLELDEETADVDLLDLTQYFQDDKDPASALRFSAVSSTNSSFVRIWITADRYLSADAWTGDANDNWTGTVDAVVTCRNTLGQTTESNRFLITIRNVNDPPVFTSTPIRTAEPGLLYNYTATAIDGDGQTIQFSINKGPPNMTIDGTTGRIEWMPRAKGLHDVAIMVSDGLDSANQSFSISVPNIGPNITSTPPLTALNGILYTYEIKAEDLNFDTLTYSLKSAIAGMVINESTGVLTWTPDMDGTYDISIMVSDGKLKAYQNYTITVSEGNLPPAFRSMSVSIATVGLLYQYDAIATDPEGTKIIFSLVSAPQGMVIDSASGRINWIPTVLGNFTVKIMASDGKGGIAFQEFVVTVIGRIQARVEFATPTDGMKVKGIIYINGTATKGTLGVEKIQIRLDSGDWNDVSGVSTWTYILDTSKLRNGKHIIQARAYDGMDYSAIVDRTIIIDNQKPASKGFISGMTGILTIGTLAIMLLCTKRRFATSDFTGLRERFDTYR